MHAGFIAITGEALAVHKVLTCLAAESSEYTPAAFVLLCSTNYLPLHSETNQSNTISYLVEAETTLQINYCLLMIQQKLSRSFIKNVATRIECYLISNSDSFII